MTEFRQIDDLKRLKRTVSMSNSPTSHHYIVLSYLYKWMQEVATQYATGSLLDFGCGGQTYRELFAGVVDQYIAADVVAAAGIELDVVITVNMPLEIAPASLDTVLSNQVLEHVPDPDFYLAEAARMLKSGGHLILTVPMQWRHHEVPFDYYRFTKYGVRELLKRNGFREVQLDPCGGVFALIGQIFCSYLSDNRITHRGWIYRMINRLFLWLDRKHSDVDDSLAWMCIAEKVGETDE